MQSLPYSVVFKIEAFLLLSRKAPVNSFEKSELMPIRHTLEPSWKEIIADDPFSPIRMAWRVMSPPLSRWLGQPMAGPMHATFIPTYECNLRCRPCGLRERIRMARMDGMQKLSVTEVERVIDDLAAMRTGRFEIGGGEPLLCRDTLHYLRYARAKGLTTQLSTNGLLLDEAMAEAIVETAVSTVEISVDGIDAKTHDRLKGRTGAFEGALSALQYLSERKRGGKPELTAVSVFSEENLVQLPHIAEKAMSCGADRYKILPKQRFHLPTGGGEMSVSFPRELRQEGDRVLEELMAIQKQRGVMDSSLAYLKLLKSYIRGEPLPVPCYAGYVTCVVDCYGQIFPCLGMLQQGRRVSNASEVSVRQHWHSASMAQTRQNLRDCRCCYWNCQTEPAFFHSFKVWAGR